MVRGARRSGAPLGTVLDERLGPIGRDRDRLVKGDLGVGSLDLGDDLRQVDPLDLVDRAPVDDVPDEEVDRRDDRDPEQRTPEPGDLCAEKEGDEHEDGMEPRRLSHQPRLHHVHEERLHDQQDPHDRQGDLRPECDGDEQRRQQRDRGTEERNEHRERDAERRQVEVRQAEHETDDDGQGDLQGDEDGLGSEKPPEGSPNRLLDEEELLGVAIGDHPLQPAQDRVDVDHGIEREDQDQEQVARDRQGRARDRLDLGVEPGRERGEERSLGLVERRRQVDRARADPERALGAYQEPVDPRSDLVATGQDVGRLASPDLGRGSHHEADAREDGHVDDRDGLSASDSQCSPGGIDQRRHDEHEEPGEEGDEEDRAEAGGDRHDLRRDREAEEDAAEHEERGCRPPASGALLACRRA